MDSKVFCSAKAGGMIWEFPAQVSVFDKALAFGRIEERNNEWSKSFRGPHFSFNVYFDQILEVVTSSKFQRLQKSLKTLAIGGIQFYSGPDGDRAEIVDLFLNCDTSEGVVAMKFTGTGRRLITDEQAQNASIPKHFDFELIASLNINEIPNYFSRSHRAELQIIFDSQLS